MSAECGFGFEPEHSPPTLDTDPDDEGAFCVTEIRSQQPTKPMAAAKHQTSLVRKLDLLSKGSRAFVVRPRAPDRRSGDRAGLQAHKQDSGEEIDAEAPRNRLTTEPTISKYRLSDTEDGSRDHVNATLNLSEMNAGSDSF
jgi:hypothetical protein